MGCWIVYRCMVIESGKTPISVSEALFRHGKRMAHSPCPGHIMLSIEKEKLLQFLHWHVNSVPQNKILIDSVFVKKQKHVNKCEIDNLFWTYPSAWLSTLCIQMSVLVSVQLLELHCWQWYLKVCMTRGSWDWDETFSVKQSNTFKHEAANSFSRWH